MPRRNLPRQWLFQRIFLPITPPPLPNYGIIYRRQSHRALQFSVLSHTPHSAVQKYKG